MAGTKYYFDTTYSYNVFGADEHIVVRLWRGTSRKDCVRVGRWAYSTFMKERLANFMAERRITKLRLTYNAKPL